MRRDSIARRDVPRAEHVLHEEDEGLCRHPYYQADAQDGTRGDVQEIRGASPQVQRDGQTRERHADNVPISDEKDIGIGTPIQSRSNQSINSGRQNKEKKN